MGCRDMATVLLAFDPRTATAWLRDLVDAHPSLGLSLCDRHASRTSVPMGWTKVDERRPTAFDVADPFDDAFSSADSGVTQTGSVPIGADVVGGSGGDRAESADAGGANSAGADGANSADGANGADGARRVVASPELPFDEPSPKWREELDEWRDELARQRQENERASAELNKSAGTSSAVEDLHEERDGNPAAAGAVETPDTDTDTDADAADAVIEVTKKTKPPASGSRVAAETESSESGDPRVDEADDGRRSERSSSDGYRAGEIHDDLSFEDIFPSLAPTSGSPTAPPQPPVIERADRVGDAASDKPVAVFRSSADPLIVETAGDRKPTAAPPTTRTSPTAPASTPADGSAPLSPGQPSDKPANRPSYMPSRSGSSTTFSVDASSPLLGRAFGFRPRP